jgi:hypothetical protein
LKKLVTLLLLFCFQFCIAQNLLIKGVSVIPMDKNEVLNNMDVFIHDGKIVKIGKSIHPIRNCEIINGKGNYLMPGLTDMHAHVPDYGNKKISVNDYFNLCLASGVTTLRSMRGSLPQLLLKDSIQKGLVIAPKLFLSAPPIHWRVKIPIDSIHYLIQQYKKSGFDFIKILSVPSEAFYEAIVAESQLVGLPVVGHIPNMNLLLALSKNQKSIEHLQGYTDYFKVKQFDALQNAIQVSKEKGIYNCPTLDWYFVGSLYYSLESLKNRAGMAYISPTLKQEWEKKIMEYSKEQNGKPNSKKEDSLGLVAMRNVLQKMKLNGCQLLLSPDASSVFQVPGFGLIEEMKIFKEMGFTNYEILRMASLVPAEYFGEDDNWGKVREAHDANLVLLLQNPLDDLGNISKIKGIILNGKWLPQSMILERIAQSK